MDKFLRKELIEYKDQKQLNPIIINLIKSKKDVKDKIKAAIFKGNKQYPNKQNIWKILVFRPNKYEFAKTKKLPIQNIRKTKTKVWLLSDELIAKEQAKKIISNKGPHKSHCLIWYSFNSLEMKGFTTNFNFV